jgi:hypothetical protein
MSDKFAPSVVVRWLDETGTCVEMTVWTPESVVAVMRAASEDGFLIQAADWASDGKPFVSQSSVPEFLERDTQIAEAIARVLWAEMARQSAQRLKLKAENSDGRLYRRIAVGVLSLVSFYEARQAFGEVYREVISNPHISTATQVGIFVIGLLGVSSVVAGMALGLTWLELMFWPNSQPGQVKRIFGTCARFAQASWRALLKFLNRPD